MEKLHFHLHIEKCDLTDKLITMNEEKMLPKTPTKIEDFTQVVLQNTTFYLPLFFHTKL